MFIDLVGSTTLSQQLDPEDYHARVVAYQTACRQVIARYEGHIAQYLGDGVLVYFGYPAAHEDDAVRAVRSGLEIVTAVSQLAYTPPLQVRIGIHTGLVVVGEIGAGERTERLALGRRRTLPPACKAWPSPIRWSSARRPIAWCKACLTCEDLGPQTLKGHLDSSDRCIASSRESEAQSRFEVAVANGLDAAGGPRSKNWACCSERWEQAKDGAGQVVLLSGEPGIGKSRLVQELKEQRRARRGDAH